MATDIAARRAADLHRVVELACTRMGLNSQGAELIKYTVNAVYLLPSEHVVVRVAAGRVGAAGGQRIVTVGRWLQTRQAPVASLFGGPQPVDVDGDHTVTFWHELLRQEGWAATDLAAPLKELHALTPDDSSLPRWDPFATARNRLAEADTSVVTREDLHWLADQWERAEQAYRACETQLRTGIIHGDPHTGNLLRQEDGQVVLCDLDEAGIGPVAYDLVPKAVGAIRFGNENFYRAFVDAYGTDVRDDPHWPVLERIRELVMVTSVLHDLQHRPTVAAQHAHRLATLKAGHHTARWNPYS